VRLTTDFFVSALIKRAFADGAFAAIARRGNAQAGAIFFVVAGRDGVRTLFGPAPQTMAPGDGSRAFSRRQSSGPDSNAVDEALAREIRFDSDLWIVELEDIRRPLTDYLTIV
jgi:hypothetical protein